jgi:hypothetical protein
MSDSERRLATDSSKWFVPSKPIGLQVNGAGNVLVTCQTSEDQPALFEYTMSGALVREIKLHGDMVDLCNAIQLDNGQLAVIHGSHDEHHMCLVDAHDGSGVDAASCGNVAVRSSVRLSNPKSLVESSKSGCIFVADNGINRVLVFRSCSLDLLMRQPLPVCLKQPWSLHLDESRGRLYVGEYDYRQGKGRLLVFDSI